MPRKMARPGCPTAVRARARVGSSRHCAPVLQEGRKAANIHASSGFIWGIPVIDLQHSAANMGRSFSFGLCRRVK
jgi:hypothetical protein